ncbi:hypothetical protein [Acuticoccus yangtzensis]|uniref:hypothetical protein n=1 Tax=Acuticoccus yangtzensis TaxID=1443441 RepID=UPI0009497B10|nr:hypothetical protein [Acuticoccus yangtzensis]
MLRILATSAAAIALSFGVANAQTTVDPDENVIDNGSVAAETDTDNNRLVPNTDGAAVPMGATPVTPVADDGLDRDEDVIDDGSVAAQTDTDNNRLMPTTAGNTAETPDPMPTSMGNGSMADDGLDADEDVIDGTIAEGADTDQNRLTPKAQ